MNKDMVAIDIGGSKFEHVIKINTKIEPNIPSDVNLDNAINSDKKKINLYVNMCVTFCVILLTLPFMVCDFYFGFSNDPCLNTKFDGFNFGIGKWLQVCGFVQLAFCLAIIAIQFMNDEIYQMVASICINLVFGFFTVGWTIAGAVLFWKYIAPNNLCGNELTTYLWARIIIGLINSGAVLFSRKNSDSD